MFKHIVDKDIEIKIRFMLKELYLIIAILWSLVIGLSIFNIIVEIIRGLPVDYMSFVYIWAMFMIVIGSIRLFVIDAIHVDNNVITFANVYINGIKTINLDEMTEYSIKSNEITIIDEKNKVKFNLGLIERSERKQVISLLDKTLANKSYLGL